MTEDVQKDMNECERPWLEPIKAALAKAFKCRSEDFKRDRELDLWGACDFYLDRPEKPRLHFAVRVRRSKFLNFATQFTLRLARKTGTETEISKLVRLVLSDNRDFVGFYAILSCLDASKLKVAHLIGLRELVTSGEIHSPAAFKMPNGDGTFFNAYDLCQTTNIDVLKFFQPVEVEDDYR